MKTLVLGFRKFRREEEGTIRVLLVPGIIGIVYGTIIMLALVNDLLAVLAVLIVAVPLIMGLIIVYLLDLRYRRSNRSSKAKGKI